MEQGTTCVALDDSKRKIVAGILRPGATQPELRELPNEPRHVRRREFGRPWRARWASCNAGRPAILLAEGISITRSTSRERPAVPALHVRECSNP